ncbi:MAG: ABC transporter substrate-binding protein [Pseudomonadota bacterium]
MSRRGVVRGVLAGLILVLWPLQAPAFSVMIVTWRGCEQACEGFQDYLRERGHEVDFLLRDAGQDAALLPRFLEEARALPVDLILSWGTSVSRGLAGTLEQAGDPAFNQELPQVFTIVADPVGAGLVQSLEATGRTNLTGTYNRVPEEVNLQTLRAYFPGFRRLGLLYHTSEPNSVLKARELEALAERLDFELVALEVPNGKGGSPVLADFEEGLAALKDARVDALYLGSSSFLQRHGEAFTATAMARGLPVLSPYEGLVRHASALLSVAPRYYDVGRLAGRQAERILVEGMQPGTLPVARVSDFAIVINMGVARRLGRFPPMPLLQVAETVE